MVLVVGCSDGLIGSVAQRLLGKNSAVLHIDKDYLCLL